MRLLRTTAILVVSLSLGAASAEDAAKDKDAKSKSDTPAQTGFFSPEEKTSDGAVTVGGQRIEYQAVAGTLIVHPKDWDDVPPKPASGDKSGDKAADKDDKNPNAEAAMFFVAYAKKGMKPEARPVTFIFNGGPGSSTVWLHMGAFGPKRVVTLDDQHSPAAPYSLIPNDYSLLDASDLVFVDAPGTGFGRIAGDGKEKAFWGVDQDAYAFAEFVSQYLSKYGRWNSPKYLFGESYGTTRSAALVNLLGANRGIDFNGVILLSQILAFDSSADAPQANPGVDLPYVLALPTYAATAWYHHKLPESPKDLPTLIDSVERFASTDYLLALQQGAGLGDAERKSIAEKLHQFTGLPVAYVLKADLRINGGEFEKTLEDDTDTTTGRLDTRFSGPTLDPLSKEAEYDPQSAAISSAYISAFNDYVRKELKFGEGRTYKPEDDAIDEKWDFLHMPPGAPQPVPGSTNVMPDLANALKFNPNLKIQLNAGYYDLATPFYEGVYEMHHLPMQAKLQANIEYHFYESGHMVYAHEPALKALHENVSGFIKRTSNVTGP